MLLPAAAAALLAVGLPSSPTIALAGTTTSPSAYQMTRPMIAGAPYWHAVQAEERRRAFWRSRGGQEGRRYARHRVLSCAQGDKSNCW